MSNSNNTAKNDVVNLALSMGGVLLRSVDVETGEVSASTDGTQRGRVPPARSGSPLSTAHKTPFLEYSSGASLLKVSRGIEGEQVGGGKRGAVKGFTVASRRRLMQTIARIRRDAELPCFVTLTYPSVFPSPKESKRHMEIFIKRIKRKFDGVGFIWKLEPQERGAPHYHLLVWGVHEVELRAWIPKAWFAIAGNDDQNHFLFHVGALGNQHCVQRVRSFRGVWSYASKYLGKTFDVAGWDEKPTGRFWAVVNRSNVPFGETLTVEIPYKQATHIMRYQRRFAKLKRRSFPSLTTFCDAEQWIKNVVIREVKK